MRMDNIYTDFMREYKKVQMICSLFVGFTTLSTAVFMLAFQEFSNYIGNQNMAKSAYLTFGLIYSGSVYFNWRLFKKTTAELGDSTKKKLSREPLIGYYYEEARRNSQKSQ